jgi:hypothetical protein
MQETQLPFFRLLAVVLALVFGSGAACAEDRERFRVAITVDDLAVHGALPPEVTRQGGRQFPGGLQGARRQGSVELYQWHEPELGPVVRQCPGIVASRGAPPGSSRLHTFAAAMKSPELQDKTFWVDGHTDMSGTRKTNKQLSQKRAQAVTKYLVSAGVLPDRLSVLEQSANSGTGSSPLVTLSAADRLRVRAAGPCAGRVRRHFEKA